MARWWGWIGKAENEKSASTAVSDMPSVSAFISRADRVIDKLVGLSAKLVPCFVPLGYARVLLFFDGAVPSDGL